MNRIMYKIVATTKEGVKFEGETDRYNRVLEITEKLAEQGMENIEVYRIEKIC